MKMSYGNYSNKETTAMTNEWDTRKQIVEIGKRIWTRGYVASNDGNISVKLNDEEVLTTPTGVSKGFMTDGHDHQVRQGRQGDHRGTRTTGPRAR